MSKKLSEMRLEELWQLFPIYLTEHDERWATWYAEEELKAGYLCMSEGSERLSFNKGYTENGFAERVFHLHLRKSGDNDELYFRDYLNAHPNVAKEYEKLKRSLWKTYEHDRDGYTERKTAFVSEHTQKAKSLRKESKMVQTKKQLRHFQILSFRLHQFRFFLVEQSASGAALYMDFQSPHSSTTV